MNAPVAWRCRGRDVRVGPAPLLMGILNVTPDSFSDGGRYATAAEAVAQGLRLAEDGAAILDVGGESTRPGAEAVAAGEERRRVVPVIAALRARTDALLSVDTTKAEVARAALEAGADLVNDVSAGTHDPDLVAAVRACGAGAVLMHMRGTPRTMQADPRYADVVREVGDYLAGRVAAWAEAGVPREALAVDPGIGFGKTPAHNLALLAGLPALGRLGRPVVVGLSRKSLLGALTGRAVGERLAASLAGLAYCAWRGAHVLRVHDVRESADALKVLAALQAAERGA